tara:strand:+ start:416 stop:2122 length:1707 start_codon:yes stop_codon:yes gene_type:complete
MNIKEFLLSPRIIILLTVVLASLWIIQPTLSTEGVAIKTIERNSSAELGGILNPSPNILPRSREQILTINTFPVTNVADYYTYVNSLKENITFSVQTDNYIYRLRTRPEYNITILNETEPQEITEEVYNETLNKTINITKIIQVPKIEKTLIGTQDIGITVEEPAKTNIRKGLELQGGTRVLLKPREAVSDDDLELIKQQIEERINVFGISGVIISTVKDLQGEKYIAVEIAGTSEEEIAQLIAKQGKFEAKIKNQSIFIGGQEDITYICRTADCSGIDPNYGCLYTGTYWSCRFAFSITLSEKAAQRQAEITDTLEIISDQGGSYLEDNLDLYLDDELVDSLRIASTLKGRAETNIQITGGGEGPTEAEARKDAFTNMKRLQTILITGSLPVKLDIVKSDTISPILGKEFIRNVWVAGILSILAVAIVVMIRYKNFFISIPMVTTMLSEVVILLGMASLIGWNLDLAAIAGIIVAVGTGVDDQIVIVDEIMRGEHSSTFQSWKERLQRAFFIIFAAYFTTIVAMIPLMTAGAGLLKGFALTTILGVTIGVFITRPAFAKMMEYVIGE